MIAMRSPARSHVPGRELINLALRSDSHAVAVKDMGMVPLEFILIVQLRCELILWGFWNPSDCDNNQLLCTGSIHI